LHELLKAGEGDGDGRFAMLTRNSKLSIVGAPGITVKGARNPISFDFNNLGIGGLDEEFREIFRRTC
jgi:hypothetical protein